MASISHSPRQMVRMVYYFVVLVFFAAAHPGMPLRITYKSAPFMIGSSTMTWLRAASDYPMDVAVH